MLTGKRSLIIAEISANHGQSFKRAVSLIREAKRCGADAVKFQAYTPDTLTIDADNRYFRIRHSAWRGQTLYELYEKAYTPWDWFKKLKKVADSEGLIFFSTAFDRTSVDFLQDLGVPFHKISSFELVDLPLIRYTARTRKPLILSTGMATAAEIKEAVDCARKAGASEVVLLKCVSSYPALPSEMNLGSLVDLKRRFALPVGISDHTLGIAVPIAAVCLGACVIEKHFTLSRRLKTPDSFFSCEPPELKMISECVRSVEESLQAPRSGMSEKERQNRMFRRSLFCVKDIKKGESFTEENVRSIRPGFGAAPKHLESFLGKKAKTGIRRGTPLHLGLIEKRRR